MKKYLMGLSILIFCASAYGEVIDLGEKNIYSETGFEKFKKFNYFSLYNYIKRY